MSRPSSPRGWGCCLSGISMQEALWTSAAGSWHCRHGAERCHGASPGSDAPGSLGSPGNRPKPSRLVAATAASCRTVAPRTDTRRTGLARAEGFPAPQARTDRRPPPANPCQRVLSPADRHRPAAARVWPCQTVPSPANLNRPTPARASPCQPPPVPSGSLQPPVTRADPQQRRCRTRPLRPVQAIPTSRHWLLLPSMPTSTDRPLTPKSASNCHPEGPLSVFARPAWAWLTCGRMQSVERQTVNARWSDSWCRYKS